MLAVVAAYVAYRRDVDAGYLDLTELVVTAAYPAYDATLLKWSVSFVPVIFVSFVLWLTLV